MNRVVAKGKENLILGPMLRFVSFEKQRRGHLVFGIVIWLIARIQCFLGVGLLKKLYLNYNDEGDNGLYNFLIGETIA